ncbi:helicase Sen1p [[Candida] jaroonii]|uniref:Helicase Sen1p n=1 Tax=[Candida] jaroonii TaxID=467808 RepID=A0ACA9Y2P3_9ASCO|nr:helicase Sen1p [[Candida] jaroonii]
MDPLNPKLSHKPPNFDEIVSYIEKAHKENTNQPAQVAAFNRCADFLKSNPHSHWFCDPYIYPIASHVLFLFSMNDTKTGLFVKDQIAASISRCPDCVSGFVKGKSQLYHTFVVNRNIPIPQVNQVLKILTNWQIKIIKDELLSSTTTGINNVVENYLYMCLYDAEILKEDVEIMNAFKLLIVQSKINQEFNGFCGSFIYFLFSDDKVLRDWTVRKLQHVQVIKDTNPMTDEFSNHSYKIQNPNTYDEKAASLFWQNCCLLIKCFKKQFLEVFNLPGDLEPRSKLDGVLYFRLLTVLRNHIFAQVSLPLPHLLEFLSHLTIEYELDLWTKWDFRGELPEKFIVSILGNSSFSRFIQSPNHVNCMITWTYPFWKSLSGIYSIRAGTRITRFYLAFNGTINNLQSLDPVFRILNESFNISSLRSSTPDKLDIEIGKLKDFRPILDDHSDVLIKCLDTFEGENKLLIADIISSALSFDISILFSNSIHLERGRNPKTFDSYPLLWKRLTGSDSKLPVPRFFSSFQDVCMIDKFEDRKSNEQLGLSVAIKAHKANVDVIVDSLNTLFNKFGELNPNHLMGIFENSQAMMGFWSCLFSAGNSQDTLLVLYQAFDVEGRLEGITKLLENYFIKSMEAIISGIKKLLVLEAFEPCPKTVRVLMDVINGLADPTEGLLRRNPGIAKDEVAQNLLIEFWSVTWKFSTMIYIKTIQWANQYSADLLIEFTRDNLDLSHLLLDSYSLMVDIVKTENVDKKFIQEVLNVFTSAMVWFKLQDASLSRSCVELIFQGLDLAVAHQLEISTDLIANMVKYGLSVRKFKTRLTEEQRTSIIAKAKEINIRVLEKVLLEVVPPANKSVSRSATPDIIEVSEGDAKQPRITNFGSNSKIPTPINPPKPTKLSNLELARLNLLNQNLPKKSAPAPARPAGFNKKEVSVGRSLNLQKKKAHDSDDSEPEGETDNSDIFVKSTKSKVTEIGIDGKPLIRTKRVKSAEEIEREENLKLRMRLNVDLNGLYRQILKWNYADSQFPGVSSEVGNLKDTYENISDYTRATEPLLLLECWSQIQSAKDRGQETPFELYVGSRVSNDGFFELYCSMSKKKVSDIKLIETDLVVITFAEMAPSGPELATYMKHPKTITWLAKVTSIKSANPETSDVTLRINPVGDMLNKLGPGVQLCAMKVMQMVTVEREYSSLKGLQYYDLCKDILASKPAEPVKIPQEKLNSAMKTYNVNSSQAQAILGTQDATGFSLIQGPPGTGKTKTILGILGYNLREEKADASEIKIVGEAVKRENKILICAPSNAAVDELVLRIRGGILNSSGELVTPKVVRLGRSDAVNSAVKDCTLEELVDKHLSAPTENNLPAIRQKKNEITDERKKLFDKKETIEDEKELAEIDYKIRLLSKERNHLLNQIEEQKEQNSKAYRSRDIERRQLQAKILNEAQIICATLSGSAHDILANTFIKFNKVIIDEACQCVELSSIIPLRYGCTQCIMVGDPNQLPPTVISQKAADLQYDQSLFVRIQKKHPDSVYLLDVQYRMHPEISLFPSREFYKSRLKNGDNTLASNTRSWHQNQLLSPYRFFNTVGAHKQNERTKSLFNTSEANIALELVENLISLMPDRDYKGKIGIISPYKEQINVLKRIFRGKLDPYVERLIDFNTVDGFQGQEKDIIIMSCVRANDAGGVGFLSDVRRMNVALTRAKSTLWVLGNATSLCRNHTWKDLIEDARSRGLVSDAKSGFLRSEYFIPPPIEPKNKTKDDRKKSDKIEDLGSEPQTNGTNSNKHTKESSPLKSDDRQNSKKRPSGEVTKEFKRQKNSPPVPTKSGIFSPESNRVIPKKPKPTIYKLPKKPEASTVESSSSEPSESKTDIAPSKSGSLPPRPKKSSLFIPRKRRP